MNIFTIPRPGYIDTGYSFNMPLYRLLLFYRAFLAGIAKITNFGLMATDKSIRETLRTADINKWPRKIGLLLRGLDTALDKNNSVTQWKRLWRIPSSVLHELTSRKEEQASSNNADNLPEPPKQRNGMATIVLACDGTYYI
ncbi:6798_t:CDS:2 [Paraglomus brasilianum]|uniref:6798_t:CDS:1 n=1 Tax=Paraglomus brasilianum TaxID=144538 RepID=A0A9N8YT94_9GLOM|nr:6798_t:CDS:2 [Paraglomus brasilianum]